MAADAMRVDYPCRARGRGADAQPAAERRMHASNRDPALLCAIPRARVSLLHGLSGRESGPSGRRRMAAPAQRKPGIFGIRDVQDLTTETHESGHELKRSVSAVQLTAMGVGAIIGTGIFVVIGQGAGIAGPAVILSFVLAAVACSFSALSYAELASSIPVSGSAYTYSYATMGELVAWIIGWDLILEYGVSVAAVAVGWGGNVNAFLEAAFGVALPDAISKSPEDGGVFNLPAVFIVLAIMLLLVRGVRESAGANLVMVVVKLIVLTFFIVVAFANFSSKNLHPFMPHGFHSVTAA